MKRSPIVIALLFLACLVVLGSRLDGRDAASVSETPVAASASGASVAPGASETSRTPSFEVRVVMPRATLPLFGILPEALEAELGGLPRELRFDHESRGAEIGSVGRDRLELSAEGWDLFIEIDGKGEVVPGTRLLFPLKLGSWQVRLRCRAASRGVGYLRTTPRAGSDELDGRFLVELPRCENARSGKALEWPPAPLTVVGSFHRLSQGAN